MDLPRIGFRAGYRASCVPALQVALVSRGEWDELFRSGAGTRRLVSRSRSSRPASCVIAPGEVIRSLGADGYLVEQLRANIP
jgi:hypothetical protein